MAAADSLARISPFRGRELNFRRWDLALSNLTIICISALDPIDILVVVLVLALLVLVLVLVKKAWLAVAEVAVMVSIEERVIMTAMNNR